MCVCLSIYCCVTKCTLSITIYFSSSFFLFKYWTWASLNNKWSALMLFSFNTFGNEPKSIEAWSNYAMASSRVMTWLGLNSPFLPLKIASCSYPFASDFSVCIVLLFVSWVLCVFIAVDVLLCLRLLSFCASLRFFSSAFFNEFCSFMNFSAAGFPCSIELLKAWVMMFS